MNMSEARAAFARRVWLGTQAHAMAAIDYEKFPATALPASRLFKLLCDMDHYARVRLGLQSPHEHATQHLGPDA